METQASLKTKFQSVWKHFDERTRRLMAANEAIHLGRGGISAVNKACGLTRKSISQGIREINEGINPVAGHVRLSGGGRKRITDTDPEIVVALESILNDDTIGDPETPLRWTCKSTRTLAKQLEIMKHPVSHTKIANILHDLGYSLQGNRKTEEGEDHPDRDDQFMHINKKVYSHLSAGLPVISVDTKKKELIGNYHNKGKQWKPKKSPTEVQGHDFAKPEIPRAYPYGIYDIGKNSGFVNVGTDHDTGEFAVASIRGWWKNEGKKIYPEAKSVMITADGGGSNGWRLRLWKHELQKFSDEFGISVIVSHFPPGTSKWNKIEHRLFSFISSNWRGEPLIDYETIVNLIAGTKTAKGLKVICRLDHAEYPTGIIVSDKEMKSLNIERDKFHGEWNYKINPRNKVI